MTDDLNALLRRATDGAAAGTVMAPAAVIARVGRRRRHARQAASSLGALAVVGAAAAAGGLLLPDGSPERLAAPGAGEGPYSVFAGPDYDTGELAASTAETSCVRDARSEQTGTTESGLRRYVVADRDQALALFDCLWRAVGPHRVRLADAAGQPALPAPDARYMLSEKDLPGIVPGTLRETGLEQSQTWLMSNPAGPLLCWGRALPSHSSCQSTNSAGLQQPASKDQRTADGRVLLAGYYSSAASDGYIEYGGERLPTAVVRYDELPNTALVLTAAPAAAAPFDSRGSAQPEGFGPFEFIEADP